MTPTFCFPTTTACVSEAPRFESIMEDVEVGAGETARFAVVVDGKPLPDIMWYKVRGWLRPPSEHGWRWREWRGDFLGDVEGIREAWTQRRRKWDPEALVTLGNKGGARPLGELALGPEGRVRLGLWCGGRTGSQADRKSGLGWGDGHLCRTRRC